VDQSRIAAEFALGEPIGPFEVVASGEQGRVWRLDTDRGRFAVKELVARQTEAGAHADVAYQEAIRAQTDIIMPAPIRTRTGCVLADIDGDQVRAYTWLDLLTSDVMIDPASVGEIVAQIHGVRFEPAGPLDDWYTEPLGKELWLEFGRALTASGMPLADAVEREIPGLIALEAHIGPAESLQNCHRDLFADNILPIAEGGLSVIDWENCGLEEPGQELAMVLVEFGYDDPARVETLSGAYRDAGGIGTLRGRASFTMTIAVFGHFYEMAAREWLDPHATDATRAHAVRRFEELLARPLTIDIIDGILDAVG